MQQVEGLAVIHKSNFPGGTTGREPPAKAGDIRYACSIPASGRSPEKEMATHSSILAWRLPMDRGARWATAPGVARSRTQLSD